MKIAQVQFTLGWNWLVEKVYILWVWQTNPAERYIAPSGAFQILQHVCAESSYVPISTFSTVKYCQNVFAKSIIPETSRQPSGCFPSTEHLQHLWRHDIHVLLPKMTGAIAYLDCTDSHSRLARTLETYLMTPREMFIVSQSEKVTKWHSRKFQTSDGHRAARMQDLEVLSGSQLGLHIAFHRTLPKPVTQKKCWPMPQQIGRMILIYLRSGLLYLQQLEFLYLGSSLK